MPNTLTVDLDSITLANAEKIAGFLIALAEYDKPEIDPAKVFGPASAPASAAPIPTTPVPAPPASAGIVSTAGPHVIIPFPPAPAPAAAPIPAPAGTLELDSKGLPWDGRIHASTKARNKDNSWKMKRGVEDALIAQVESELRRVMAIPSPQHAPIAAQPPMVASSVQTTVASPTAAINPVPSPAPAPIQITPQMQAEYVAFIGSTSNAIHAGKLTEQELLQCLASVGVESLPLLGARLDLLPAIAGIVNGIIAGRSA